MGKVKTDDGKDMDFNLYKLLTFELCKGHFTEKEAEEAIKKIKVHKKYIFNAVTLIKKIALLNNFGVDVSMTFWLQEESQIGIKLYKKDCYNLDRDEHLTVIKDMIDRYSDGTKGVHIPILDPTKEDIVLEEYMINRKFYKEKIAERFISK